MNHLQVIALSLGGFGILCGLWASYFPQEAQQFFREFPRNEKIGRVLMLINVAWSLYLFNQMDLGPWEKVYPLGIELKIKSIVYILSPLIYWFIIRYINHYLGARGLAWLLILAAKPITKICFLRDEPSRLIITTLAYSWVIIGILIFSAPHWLRNWLTFWQANSQRWTWGCRAKIIFGCALVALGLFAYGSHNP